MSSIKDYKKFLESKDYSENTVNSYLRSVREFQRFLNKPLIEAVPEDWDDFAWSLRRKGRKNRTLNLKLNGIKSYYRYIHRTQGLPRETEKMLSLEHLSVPDYDRKILTEKEIQEILDQLLDIRDKAIVATLFSTGIRVGELSKLNKKSFVEKEDYVVVKIKDAKNRKNRQVYMNYKYYDYVSDYMYSHENSSGHAFINKTDKNRISYKTVIRRVSHIGKETIGEKLRPHDFRASCFTHLYRQGVDIYTIKEIAGHSDISTTEKYIQGDESDIAPKTIDAFKTKGCD